MLTGKGTEESLAALGELVEYAIVKCGSKGSWLKSKTQQVFIPSNEIEVTDSTAAGDMYAGGFMFGLLQGYDLEACGHLATYCAETVIQHVGARIPENLRQLAEAYLAENYPEGSRLAEVQA